MVKDAAQIIYETLARGMSGNPGCMLSWERVTKINHAPYPPYIQLNAFQLRDLSIKAAQLVEDKGGFKHKK